MNARDELATVIHRRICEDSLSDCLEDEGYCVKAAVELLGAGYTKPRTITTVEELDALRTDSTIRSTQGGIWFKETSGKGCAWTEPGAHSWHWPTDIALPATVLYEPTA